MEVPSFRKLMWGGEVRVNAAADARCAAISTAATCFSAGKNCKGGGSSEDEGPFFDLEFAVPVVSGDLEEFNMSVSSSGNRVSSSSPCLTEEILFNGRLFEMESSSSSSSMFYSPAVSEANFKSQFPASVLKSATKLRVFMFRSSSKGRPDSSADSIKFIKEEKKLYKDVILHYISKIKPLYVKVSKLRFSGPTGRNKEDSASLAAAAKKQSKATGSSLPSRFKVGPGRLRKSRSASSAVASVFSPPTMTLRCDDSLLQQDDGIQGAIAHCKRSFHSEKGLWTTESPFLRSLSDPGGERSAGGHCRTKSSRGDDSTVC